MPGVLTTTATRSGPSVVGIAPASTFFVAGLTERGPTTESPLLRAMGDFLRVYGDRVTYGAVYDSIRTFFEEGGLQAHVARTVGPAASTGFFVLMDANAVPAATLRIEALGAGAWSTGVTVQVRAGVQTNTFDLIIAYGEDAETFLNLASPSAAVAALRASSYVRGIDQGSASVAPANNPAVRVATPLSAGGDDRAAVVANTYADALDRLGPGFGAGAVAIPGQAAAAVAARVLAHCKANNRIGLLAASAASTPDSAIAQKATVQAAVTNEEYLGIFYPWIVIPDGAGGTRTISPEGYVAGVRARTQVGAGPWRAPAGQIATARYVIGVERDLTRAEGDRLDDNEVSAVRVIANEVRLYGWRSLSGNEADYGFLVGRDMLNYLVTEGEKRLEQFVMRPIDARGHLFGEIAAEIIGLVEPIRVVGGLYEQLASDGSPLDAGYSVNTGSSVNTATTLLAGEARVELAVRIAPTGSLIRLLVTKAGLTATL